MRYYIRPTFNHISFKSRKDAINYAQSVNQYCSLKYWVDRNTNGLWYIYCDKGVFISDDKIDNFPHPYKIILTDF